MASSWDALTVPEALRLLGKCDKSSDARITARLALRAGARPTLPLDSDAQPLAISSYSYSDVRPSGLFLTETHDACSTTLLGGAPAPTASAASLRGSIDATQDGTLRPLFFDRDTERLLPSVHLLKQEQLFDFYFQLSLIPSAGYDYCTQ